MIGQPGYKVRKYEIQFKKSLLRFCLVFLFVIFLGVVSKFFLNRIPLEERILDSLQLPPQYQVEFHQPRFQFAQGVMPVLGFAFKRFQVNETRCPTKRMLAHDVLLVVNPWRILVGEFKLGWANIGFLELDHPQNCSSEVSVSQSYQSMGPSHLGNLSQENNAVKVKKILQENFLKELFANTRRLQSFNKMSYLIVDSFEFRGLQSLNQLFVATGRLSAKIKKIVDVDIILKSFLYKKTKVPVNSMGLNLLVSKESLKLSIKSNIREGELISQLEIANEPTFPTQLNLSLDKIPLSSMSELLIPKTPLNYLWTTCAIAVEAPWANFLQAPFKFKDCFLDGPYGSVIFSHLQASLSQLDSLHGEFKGLNLDQVIQTKRRLSFSGVLAKYGVLSGVLAYKDGQLAIEGAVENTEVVFSKNNLRDIQKVQKIPFFFKGNVKKWQFRLSQILLQEGKVVGHIKVQKKTNSSEALGQVSFHNLRFSPKIYKLMLGAEPANLKLYGKFSLQNGALENWSAFLATPRLKSQFYDLLNLKVKAQKGMNYESHISLQASGGEVNSESSLINWLRPTALNESWLENKNIGLRELSVKLKLLSDQKVTWQRGYLRLKNDWQLSSEGSLDSQKNLTGWLQWDPPGKNFIRWSYQGPFFKGRWVPESPWLHSWLSKNPSFSQQHPEIFYQPSSEESLGNKINEARKKAIEKVKSVLSTPNKEEKL